MRLYQLTNNYQLLLDKIEECPELAKDENLVAEIESLEGSIEEKIKNKAIIVKLMQADISLIETEIEKLKKKQQTLQDKVDWFKNDICMNMQKMSLTKVRNNPYFNINLMEGQYKVDDFDPSLIPDEYKKHKETVYLDKIRMREEMIEGVIIPGAQLVREKYISIR